MKFILGIPISDLAPDFIHTHRQHSPLTKILSVLQDGVLIGTRKDTCGYDIMKISLKLSGYILIYYCYHLLTVHLLVLLTK